MRFFLSPFALMSLALAGCASTPVPQTTEVAASRSDQLAAQNDARSAAQAAKYEPNARPSSGRCAGGSQGAGAGLGICWSSEVNPSADHLKNAQRYHALAEKQRAESAKLRTAESQACVDVTELDRSMSPFSHPEDVATVESLRTAAPPTRLLGAVITFQAVEGMTGPRLERLVSCHLARNACLENGAAEVSYCPLVLKNVKASVTTAAGGLFAVAVSSEDPAIAQEILRRSQALVVH